MGLALKLIIEEDATLAQQYGMPVSGESTLCLGYVKEQLKENLSNFAKPLVGKVRLYTDEGIVEKNTDAAGNPLMFVEAGALAKALDMHTTTPWVCGIYAMLSAIPSSTRVVLYWE